ncbi:hypothetical protein SAMN04489740_4041 [Arthrobacter alpinus]|uniref:Uncharacterized protein n=1 Tax=Arthrobacter alpinus TaxID=656366 RepID=A0A1H5PAC6_9MICC|nr:hypothetical protein [Arthrobacter alpinus]SEF10859.1 hypothetical protein SAMN04489740_4041 [Arthrobacter alpinus]
MSRIDDLLAESNDRWSLAMGNAQGAEDLGLGPAVKTYYTRYVPGGVLVLLVSGIWVGNLVFGAAPSGWASLSFGFVFAMGGAAIGGLIYNSKKVAPAARLNTVNVLYPLAADERKSINRQIAGKAPVDEQHLPVARAGAVQQRKSLAMQLVVLPAYLFLFASQFSSWVERGHPFIWIMAVLAAAATVVIVFIGRDFRRTTRFLTGPGR